MNMLFYNLCFIFLNEWMIWFLIYIFIVMLWKCGLIRQIMFIVDRIRYQIGLDCMSDGTVYQILIKYELLIYNNISYHTSASEIRKNITLLRPISNEVEGQVGYGRQTRYFSCISTSGCDNVFSSSMNRAYVPSVFLCGALGSSIQWYCD